MRLNAANKSLRLATNYRFPRWMIVSIHRRNKHAPQHIDRERAGVRLEAERAEPEARGKRLIALFGAAPHSLFERF